MRRWLLVLLFLLVGSTIAYGQSFPCGTGASQIPCTVGVWYQIPNSSIRSVVPIIPGIAGEAGPSGIITAFSSAAYDSKRDRLCSLASGGHASYLGNGVYCFDLNTLTWSMVKAPSTSTCDNCDIYPDGQPASKHGQDGVEYMPWNDKFWRWAAFQHGLGNFGDQWDIFDPTNNTWTEPSKGTHPNNSVSGVVPASVADPQTQMIYWDNKPELWQYNPATNVWTNLGSDDNICGSSTQPNWALDPEHHQVICAGNAGGLGTIKLDSPYTATTLGNPANCGNVGFAKPGMDWDPVLHRMVIWAGGTTVYLYDPVANSCTTQTIANPPPGSFNGLNGKFRYSPRFGVFVEWDSPLSSDAALDTPVFTLRLDNPAASDFAYRCGQTGVIVCEGFDDTAHFTHSAFGDYLTRSGALANNGGNLWPVQDTSVKVSGAGSLRFDIPAPSGSSNPDGSWWLMFQSNVAASSATATLFGPANPGPLYIQWRQRMNQNFINTGGSSYFKQVDIHSTKLSCGQEELTMVNSFNRKQPEMYSQCGSDPFEDPNPNEPGTPPTGGNVYLQQGDTRYTIGYNCPHLPATGTCFQYPADTWVTYTVKLIIAPSGWGTASSTIQAWATLDGQDYPTHMFVNQPTHILNQDSSTDATPGFAGIELLPYFSNGYSGAINPSQTWYDELVISTQPIPVPRSAGGAAPTTNPPTNLQVIVK